jgi:hypothetical protein
LIKENMSALERMMHQIGSFEPFKAKRMLALLKARRIPFEMEADHPARPLQLGMYPEGSGLAVFVPESMQDGAMAALGELSPV